MDKPTPPQSCRVTDVFHDNCIVHWTPPKDDGGPKKIKVENLTQGHKYRFRVVAANKIGVSDPCEMKGDDILMKDPWDEPDPCGKPDILDWGPNHADLAWAPPESDGGHARSAWFGPQSRISGFPHGSGSSQGSFIRMSSPFISHGSDTPILFAATTLNLYLCPCVRFSTFIFLGPPSSVLAQGDQVALPVVVSTHSTTYFLIGVPPSSLGGVQ